MTDPTASTPVDCARAEGRDPLFCVHVLGPDDVYAAPDRLTAFRWAAALNNATLPFNQDADDDRYVICHANVELWDGTAEEHAEALPQATELMTPRRGVIPPGQVVEIDYTNREGRRAVRKIKPTGRMLVGMDQWHPEAPWLIEARDVERNVMRTFDPAKIHRWGDALVAPAAVAGHALVPREPTAEVLRSLRDDRLGNLGLHRHLELGRLRSDVEAHEFYEWFLEVVTGQHTSTSTEVSVDCLASTLSSGGDEWRGLRTTLAREIETIARECRDDRLELEGEWLPQPARSIHGALCDVLALIDGASSVDAAAPPAAPAGDAVLPCDVKVQPATVIRAGCPVSTLLNAIEQRRKWIAKGQTVPAWPAPAPPADPTYCPQSSPSDHLDYLGAFADGSAYPAEVKADAERTIAALRAAIVPAPPAGRAPAGVVDLVDDLLEAHGSYCAVDSSLLPQERGTSDALADAEDKLGLARIALLSAIADRDRELDALRGGGARGGVSLTLDQARGAYSRGVIDYYAFAEGETDKDRAHLAGLRAIVDRIEAEGRPGRAGGEADRG